jgi:diguanylate cyclase (GGDEF)-like protein
MLFIVKSNYSKNSKYSYCYQIFFKLYSKYMNKKGIFVLKSKIYILVILFVGFIVASFLYLNFTVSKMEDKIYNEKAVSLQQNLEWKIQEKQKALIKIVLTLAQYQQIQDILESGNYGDIHLETITQKLKEKTNYSEVWFQIIDKNANSFYRSWTDKRGDSLLDARIDIASNLKNPKTKSTISVGKFDLTFKSIVPIYKNEVFLGFVESIAKFGSISKELEKLGINSLFLVDKRYKSQLTHAYTKKFMNDCYIANGDTKESLVSRVKEIGLPELLKRSYYVDEASSSFITYYIVRDIKDRSMSYMMLSVPLSEINFNEINSFRTHFELFLLFTLIVLIILLSYLMVQDKNRALEYVAHHDTLTTLPNRSLFLDRLEQAIKQEKRNRCSFALLFIDLDHFKNINDIFGHHIGDMVLVEVATHLKKNLRNVDTVARLGGDEFTVIIEDIHANSDVIMIIDKIFDSLQMPLRCDDAVVPKIELSIGVSLYPQDGTTSDELLRNADSSMYVSKTIEGSAYTFYCDSQDL